MGVWKVFRASSVLDKINLQVIIAIVACKLRFQTKKLQFILLIRKNSEMRNCLGANTLFVLEGGLFIGLNC